MSMTDLFVFVGFSILIARAIRYGLTRTLFWPLATLTSGFLSISVYFLSNNLWCTLATYALSAFLIRKLLPVFQKKPDPDSPTTLSFSNKIMAVAVNLVWGAFLTFAIVLPLSIMPFEQFNLTDISYDIFHSRTYAQIAAIMVIPLNKNSSAAKTCTSCDPQFNTLINAPMTQDLLKDPRILKLINDPEFQDALNKKDIAKLSRHPVLRELRHDPAFLLKALRLQMTIQANAKY